MSSQTVGRCWAALPESRETLALSGCLRLLPGQPVAQGISEVIADQMADALSRGIGLVI